MTSHPNRSRKFWAIEHPGGVHCFSDRNERAAWCSAGGPGHREPLDREIPAHRRTIQQAAETRRFRSHKLSDNA